MADWYYSRDGKTTEGPIPEREISSLVAAGVLSPGSLVVGIGESVWRSVGDVFTGSVPPRAETSTLPPPLPQAAVISAPPAPSVSAPAAIESSRSRFGKLGIVGKLAVVCGAGLLLLIVLAGTAGGPNRQQLETELARVEAEGFQLSREALTLRSVISDAQFSQIWGTSAALWGAVQDDGGLAWDGVTTLGSAAMDEQQALENLKQIRGRLEQLADRRQQLLQQLR